MFKTLSNLFASFIVASSVFSAEAKDNHQQEQYSPYVSKDQKPMRVFWGDTHVHTNLSTDAFGFGVSLGPEEALQFASGETVTSSHGLSARLQRPLDFVVLADHAESLGMMTLVREGNEKMLADPVVSDWHRRLNGSAEEESELQKMFLTAAGRRQAFSKLDEISTPDMSQSVWDKTIATAERFYSPGTFTTLLGYEWTLSPGGSNLHRVVVFRDGPDRVTAQLPLSAYASNDPEELWAHLKEYEALTGGRVLAIPHNGNLSNGLMFPNRKANGDALDSKYLKERHRWEPVIEVTQIKGDGEAHPFLSPDDEFADYETWDLGNFAGVLKTNDMLRFEYARSGLRTGLEFEMNGDVNPYQFGMIGSTDSHTGLATADEDNFFGKHSRVEPNAKRMQHPVGKAGEQIVYGWQQAASGYAAVWATDNTREALWDAIARREVYATTGPRITLRVFGGWEFDDDDASAMNIAEVGYKKGVPMGAELTSNQGSTPSLLIAAARDPVGANLDRVQVIKGWIDKEGKTHEHVYDVAWSDARQVDESGKLTPVGNSIDPTIPAARNNIGAAQLQLRWQDPDFDSTLPAFYYVRVLQIPTPRWTAYDTKRFELEEQEIPMITQERAYSSPIWCTP